MTTAPHNADDHPLPGNQPAVVAAPQPCDFDPNASLGAGSAIVREAGFGSLAAMRVLFDVAMDAALAKHDDDPYAIVAAAEAVAFARLCAAHRLPFDVRKLAAALCLTSGRTRRIGFGPAADDLMSESICILERLADQGDDVAAMASGQLVTAHPETVAFAKTMLAAMEE
jgi:hypothetical protein